MFDLKQPCVNCPFRKGQGELYQLHAQRLHEIMAASSFPCHKTVTFDHECQADEENWDEQYRPIKDDSRAQQCAGLMAILAREGRENQMMQVAMRIGILDTGKLDPKGETYESLGEVFEAHSPG